MRRALQTLGGVLAFILAIAAAAVLVPIDHEATGGTTLTGQLTIPSPTMVQPGAIYSGQALRLGESIANTFDPRSSGLTRPVGSWLYTRDGTLAYAKTGTASTGWELLTSGAIGGSNAASQRTVRAAQLTGISTSLLTCFREDFAIHPSGAAAGVYTSFASGSGTLAPSVNTIGGRSDVSSGATANSFYILATQPTLFGPPASNRLYFGARVAVTTAIDAQTFAITGLQVSGFGADVAIGVCGSNSTTNFVLQYDSLDCLGTFLSTGQAINTSFHVFELWTVADGKYHAAVDGIEISGSPVTPASPPATQLKMMADVRNGTTATNRNMQIDWWHGCWSES